MATIPAGTAADVDAAVAAAQRRVPGVVGHADRGAGQVPDAHRRRPRRAHGRDRHDDLQGDRDGQVAVADRPGRPADQQLQRGRRAWPRATQFEETVGNSLDRARADRRGRLHHPVELPAAPDRRQGRLRHGRRLHRRAQAERGRAGRRVHPRRDHQRGRPAGRRVQPRLGHRPGGRRGHRRAPRRRHGVVHRLHPRRQARRPARRRDDQEDRPRARRQVGQRAPRRPRRGRLRQGRHRRRRQVRSSTPARPARRSPACSCRATRLAEAEADRGRGRRRKVVVGSPFAEGVHLGPLASAAQRDRVQGYIQKGIDEGATLVAGGLGAPEGLDTGFYVRPTVFSDVTPGHDHRPGGDLRPGAVDPAVRHRGRRRAHRQRRGLRPRRRRVVGRRRARPRPSRAGCAPARWRSTAARSTRTPRSAATSSRASAASTAATASRSSSRSRPSSTEVPRARTGERDHQHSIRSRKRSTACDDS